MVNTQYPWSFAFEMFLLKGELKKLLAFLKLASSSNYNSFYSKKSSENTLV